MRSLTILAALLLAVGGCAGTMPAMKYPVEINYQERQDSARRAALRAASARAAAYADSVTGHQAINNGQTDTSQRVAKALAAADITLPQVVAYLYANGWQVVPAPMPDWTWAKPTTGSPVAYYAWEMRGACADTVLLSYLPDVAGNVTLKVRGVDTQQRIGPWSLVGVTGDGTLLPGVGE